MMRAIGTSSGCADPSFGAAAASAGPTSAETRSSAKNPARAQDRNLMAPER